MIYFCQLIQEGNLELQFFDNCFDDEVANTVVYISSELKMCKGIAFIMDTYFIFIDKVPELPGDGNFAFCDGSRVNIINDGPKAPACCQLRNTAAHGTGTTNTNRSDHNMIFEICNLNP